jgi:hypothetical protein
MSLKAISHLHKAANTGHRTVKQLLEDELERHNNAEWPEEERYNKAVILYLDDTKEEYHTGFAQAGMKMSECVALCSISESRFEKEMNY